MSTYFEKLNRRKVRGVLNCLIESTFFYRTDEPELHDYLRRNLSEFERFFDELYGFSLYADRKMARLIKREQHNPRLPPSSRDLFQLTRREECLAFVYLLEFHEHELQRQNLHYEKDADVRFLLEDFVRFALARAKEELGERAPPDAKLFEAISALFAKLSRHRFVAEVERAAASEGEDLPAGLREHVLCEALPGLHTYDPSAVNHSIFRAAYGAAETDAPEEGETVQEQERSV